MRLCIVACLLFVTGLQAYDGGDHWADDYVDFAPTTLYGMYENDSDSAMVICTDFKAAQIMFEFNYETTNGDMQTGKLYIPTDASVVPEESACLNMSGVVYVQVTQGANKGVEVPQYSAYTTVAFGNGAGKFTLFFSNNTNPPYNVPGWFQFAVWKVDLTLYMTHPNMSANYPNAANSTLTYSGISNNDDTVNGRWWKRFGAYSQYSFLCDTNLQIQVEPNLKFNFQYMKLSALNLGDQGYTNNTYPENRCNYDYEKNDQVAVWIGSVQTGFTLLFLGAYFIYLKKRGPVTVPKWIIEPALRNAEVKPIDDHEYERRMSSAKPTDDTNGLPTKRSLNANDDDLPTYDETF